MAVMPPTATAANKPMGFRELAAGQPQRRRLIISIEGAEKTGKNHFAFGAPGPIYFHSFDYGDEGVVEKFLATGKKIHKAEYRLDVPPGTSTDATSKAATPVWDAFSTNYRIGITKGRTTIVDTGTDAYELVRLSYFGKLTQVMPHHYGPVNAEYKDLFRQAFSSDSNLIFLQRIKDEWINKVNAQGKEVGTKTGAMVMAGYSATKYETQVHLRAFKDSEGFKMEVVTCRQNPDIEGMVLEGAMNSFAGLGQMVYPESTEEEWA